MVNRTFNFPVASVRKSPVIWVRKVNVEWFCGECGHQTKGTTAVEFTLRLANGKQKGEPGYGECQKKFICVSCAGALLENALRDVKAIENIGIDAFAIMKRI